jgi:hypothetical protein
MLILPPKPFKTIQLFLNENKPLVYKFMVKHVTLGIKNKLDKVELFQITNPNGTGSSPYVAIVKHIQYHTVLEDAIKYCVRVEDYETAAKARDSLQVLKETEINKLLNERKE